MKLDLHHCDDRINRTLKRALKGKQKRDFTKDVMLMTRRDYDWEHRRTQPTASPDQIVNQIDEVMRHWKKKIPKSTYKALETCKIHAAKGKVIHIRLVMMNILYNHILVFLIKCKNTRIH